MLLGACEEGAVVRGTLPPGGLKMNYRSLARTGLQVSELGFGAWGIGKAMWLGADDDESLRIAPPGDRAGCELHRHCTRLWGRSQRGAGGPGGARGEGGCSCLVEGAPKNQKWPAPQGVPADEAFRLPGSWSAPSEAWRTLGSRR